MLEGQDIICIAPNPWDDIWRRRHQLMSRFARGNRVLYVEPARFILFALLNRKGLVSLLKGRFYSRQEGDNLFILSQYLMLPFEQTGLRRGSSVIKRINDWFCIAMLKGTLRRLKFKKPILWVYYTSRSGDFVGKCGEKLVICDVFDRYAAFPYNRNDPWLKQFIDREDANLIERADVVFASSELLHTHCQGFSENVHLVSNGADTVLADSVPVSPADTANIPHPVLGYVGGIFDKLDFDLLRHLAEEHPKWSILMVGPTGAASEEDEKRISSLREKGNVFFVGSKHRKELPGYYETIDVALMPYELTEHTDHIFPLKMFEYMAFRKPIVSTDIPAARQFPGIISIAHSREQFAETVSQLLGDDNGSRIQQGVAIAQQNSWDQKVKDISQVIRDCLHERGISLSP
ncbi:MAG: UDP-glycosyl transferase/glycogen phosphorylase [Dehalococcoidia bacterium]|nr:UDP-glycosyl transferase/glycogen phosphorylase [Dehalococcoidia bacterium]